MHRERENLQVGLIYDFHPWKRNLLLTAVLTVWLCGFLVSENDKKRFVAKFKELTKINNITILSLIRYFYTKESAGMLEDDLIIAKYKNSDGIRRYYAFFLLSMSRLYAHSTTKYNSFW